MTGCNNKKYCAAYRAYRRMILPDELNKKQKHALYKSEEMWYI